MSNRGKPAVVTTRWWWVASCWCAVTAATSRRSEGYRSRHQRFRSVRGGREDPAARRAWFAATSCARIRPRKRSGPAGFPKPASMTRRKAFAADISANGRAKLTARRSSQAWPVYRFAAIDGAAPGGDICSWISITACAARSSGSMPNRPARTSSQSRPRRHHQGRRRFRARGQAEKGLAFDIDNLFR